MTSITIHPPSEQRYISASGATTLPSPLPRLLQTPAGLALIEIQGHINHPKDPSSGSDTVPIGSLEFPDYRPGDPLLADDGSGKWQNRIWLAVGEHQRLTGEVKKLGKPLGVLRRKEAEGGMEGVQGDESVDEKSDDLEIVEVIRWKVVFSSRPEPVGVAIEV